MKDTKEIKIERYPTYIVVYNILTVNETEYLKKSLSVWDDAYFRYSFKAYLEEQEKDIMVVPGAFSVSKLLSYYPDAIVEDRHLIFDNYIEINKELKCQPRDYIQLEAVKFLSMNKFSQKYLSLQTGLGKTYCAINHFVNTNKLPIIILNSSILAEQWIDKIIEYTNIEVEEIYLISGQKSVQKIMNMDAKERKQYKVYIAMYQTLENVLKRENGHQELYKIIKKLKIGIKIYDEAHYFFKLIFEIDCSSKCETVYLSATPKRTDFKENRVYSRMFDNLGYHRRGYPSKYLNVYMYYYNSDCPTEELINFKIKKGFSVTNFNKYIHTRDELTNNIMIHLFKMIYKDYDEENKKRIIYVYGLIDTVEQKKNFLQEYFNENGIPLTIGSITGKVNKKKQKEIKDNSDVIITTYSSFCQGIDIDNLSVVINNVPISGDAPLNQMSGRLRLRPGHNVYYVQTYDIGVPDIERFIKNNIKYFEKTSKKIVTFNGIGTKKKGINKKR